MIKNCTVFCGSRLGASPRYAEAARAVGTALAQNALTLVYGGGHTGLMGTVADATLAAGGSVKGIIPAFLEEKEVMHEGVTALTITDDMPSRKKLLFDWGDAFIILPGGFGTFDEFYEILVNRQIGLHYKPIVILNVDNWAAPTLALIQAVIDQGFAEAATSTFLDVVEDVPQLMQKLLAPAATP